MCVGGKQSFRLLAWRNLVAADLKQLSHSLTHCRASIHFMGTTQSVSMNLK